MTKLHWTQTPAGKRKMRLMVKKSWSKSARAKRAATMASKQEKIRNPGVKEYWRQWRIEHGRKPDAVTRPHRKKRKPKLESPAVKLLLPGIKREFDLAYKIADEPPTPTQQEDAAKHEEAIKVAYASGHVMGWLAAYAGSQNVTQSSLTEGVAGFLAGQTGR